MGLKEALIVNWKGRVIEYQETPLYVVDQFEYKNKIYLYTINTKIKDNVIDINFLVKNYDDVFEHVVDDRLYDQLITIEAGRISVMELAKLLKKLKNA